MVYSMVCCRDYLASIILKAISGAFYKLWQNQTDCTIYCMQGGYYEKCNKGRFGTRASCAE